MAKGKGATAPKEEQDEKVTNPDGETPREQQPKAEVKKPFDPSEMREKPAAKLSQRIKESREILKHPVPEGMVVFEAPDGFCMLGEADKPHMRYKTEDGKSMLINPRRERS